MVELIYRKGRLIIRGRYFKYIFFLICGIFHEQKRIQPNIDINCCAHSIWDVSCRLARLSVLALRCAFPLAIHTFRPNVLCCALLKKKKTASLQAKTVSHRRRRKSSICHRWLLELRGVPTSLLQLWPSFWSGRSRRRAGVGSTGWARGLDVGSTGLFWLRGVGLREHAKLAASSKRISESRELSRNLLFLSLPLPVWFRLSLSRALKPFLMMTLSASHWKAEEQRPPGPAATKVTASQLMLSSISAFHVGPHLAI